MNEIPEFKNAVTSFRCFLARQGYPDRLLWVFRDDLWFRRPDQVFMRLPLPSVNTHLAEKVYGEGRKQGFVEIAAVAINNDHVAATVWFPRFPKEEIQGWSCGLKLAIRQPLPVGTVIDGLGWWVVRCFPGYRRYQRLVGNLGTRRWAASSGNYED